MKRSHLVLLISYLTVLLLVYTGVSKLIDFTAYTGQMLNQPLPKWFSGILVYVIPIVELVLAVMLVVPIFRKMGLLLSGVMMLNFTIYVASIILRAFPRVPCSCAGIFKTMSWELHFWVNLFYTVIAFTGFLLENKNVSHDAINNTAVRQPDPLTTGER